MPRSHIPHALRQVVIARAGGRCEYCLLHQDDRPKSHQVDHIVARKHGGQTVRENLVLACAVCNNNKGSDLATLDFPIGGFSPPEGRLARGCKPPAFSRFLFQSAVKSAESF